MGLPKSSPIFLPAGNVTIRTAFLQEIVMPASATLFRSLWRLTLPVATTAALAGCAAVSLDTPDWPPPPRYSAPARNATLAAAPSSAQAVAPVQAPPPAATATSEAIPAQPATAAAPLPAALQVHGDGVDVIPCTISLSKCLVNYWIYSFDMAACRNLWYNTAVFEVDIYLRLLLFLMFLGY